MVNLWCHAELNNPAVISNLAIKQLAITIWDNCILTSVEVTRREKFMVNFSKSSTDGGLRGRPSLDCSDRSSMHADRTACMDRLFGHPSAWLSSATDFRLNVSIVNILTSMFCSNLSMIYSPFTLQHSNIRWMSQRQSNRNTQSKNNNYKARAQNIARKEKSGEPGRPWNRQSRENQND